jgi:hypothetical protein
MKRFGVVLITFVFLTWVNAAKATINFPEWIDAQTKKYQEDLQSENASLSSEDIARAEQRLKEALNEKDWTTVANEYGHLLGKSPDKGEYWVQLSLALQKKNIEKKDWKNEQGAQYAAIRAYQLAKQQEDKEKQAIALLAYGNTLNVDNKYESPNYLEILYEIKSLVDIQDLKKRLPEYEDLMSFSFLNTRVNNQTSIPSACFIFSHPLAPKGIQYSDFVTLSPKVDGDFIVNGRELCFSPFKYGENYDVTFKAGLPSELREKTKAELKVSFKVKDQNSRLSFTNKAYVLMRNEVASIPLTSVNVDSVNVKVLHISDRGLNQIFTGSDDFLHTLWDYKIGEISKTQGELLWQGEMELGGEKNKTVTKQFPFSEVVKQSKPGVYVIQAEEKGALYGEKSFATQWLIISDMALTTLSSEEGGITVNVRSLKTAEALPGVEVQLLAINNTILGKVKTSKEGLAVFEKNITGGQGGNRPRLILAYGAKGDFSFIDLQQPAFDLSDRGVSGRKMPGVFDAYLYTEQGIYRPNDTVHLNTLLRDNLGVAKGQLPLTFSVLRPDNVEVGRYTLKGNEVGFYELEIPLSSSTRTGQWTVVAYIDPKKPPVGQVQFAVEDFVPSRMLVSLKEDKKLLTPKQPVQVTVSARYLFGVVASDIAGTANMILREQANPYSQFPGFSFGLANETFINTRSDLVFSPLDKKGESSFSVALDKIPETNKPLEAVVQVTLADTGGRPEIGSLTIPVRLAPFMIGIKPLFKNNQVAEEESKASFEVITLTPEGKYLGVENLKYELFEEQLNYTWYQPDSNLAWQYKAAVEDKFLSKGVIQTKDNAAFNLGVPLKDWGRYRLVIKDPKTEVQSSVRFYKGWVETGSNSDTPDRLNIKTDKENYKTGDAAQLYIESPFDGEALLTVANNTVLETRNIKIAKKGTKVKLNVDASWGTGAYCMISAFRPINQADRKEKAFLPKRAVGIAWIGMNTIDNTLKIELSIPQEVLPRQKIDIPIQVSREDKERLSKNTQVTIAAVDEGILKLTEFKTPNPRDYFFDKRLLGIEVRDLYGKLIEPLPGSVGVLKMGGDGGALSRNLQALSKKSFKVVSLYSGLVSLDKAGKGLVQLNIPEFNGTLRLMAVAFDEKRLGNQQNDLLVRDPIIIEGILPRFLAKGDQSQLSLSLYNVKGEVGEYSLVFEAEGTIALKGNKEQKIRLEKDTTYHNNIPIEATGIGDGKIRVRLTKTNMAANTAEKNIDITNVFEISVRPKIAYTTQTVSRFLKGGESDKLKLELLSGFVPGTETVAITWSKKVPWDTASLFKHLAEYPYNCVEQSTSKGFGALLSPAPQNKAGVNQVLAMLSEKQNPNGSFDLWFNPKAEGDVWLTAYVVDFLLRSKEAGFDVPHFTLERSMHWLASYVERNNSDNMNFEGVAYSLYVLSKANRVEAGSVRYFYDTYYEKLSSPFGCALIGAALAEKGDSDRTLAAFANAYSFEENEMQIAPYGTVLRDRAGVLALAQEALIKMPALMPLNSTIEVMMKALAEETQTTKQFSTQEAVWLLLAAHGLNKTPSREPINILLNNKPLIAENSPLRVDFTSAEFQQVIEISNQSKEDLWQHVALTGIPATKPEAIDQGVSITRQYYDFEGKELDPASVKQGTQMVVVLKIDPKDAMPHQWLVVDFLPAGFEIENARLSQNKNNLTFPWLGESTTAQFIEPRDDRFVSSVLSKDSQTIQLAYVVRAVSIGNYVRPGLFVEDMYSPKYYARSEEKTTQILAP